MLRFARRIRITRSGDGPIFSGKWACSGEPVTMTSAELGPLGLGDLLDRAVTLFVHRFGSLVGALAIVYVPLAIVQWRTLGWLDTYKTTLTREQLASLMLNTIVGLLVWAFARTAAVAIAQAGYAQHTLSLGAAYRRAVARFAAQAVTLIFGTLIGMAIFFVALMPFAIGLFTTFGSLRGPARVVALAVGGVVGLMLGAWLFFAWELATVRVAIAPKPPYAALFAALRATAFRRPWHSLLAALTLMLIVFGGSLIFSVLAQLMPLGTLRTTLDFAIAPASSILIEALSVTFLVAYDVDLAVRFEGIDLAAALDAAPPLSARRG